jgi:hypothetical protein
VDYLRDFAEADETDPEHNKVLPFWAGPPSPDGAVRSDPMEERGRHPRMPDGSGVRRLNRRRRCHGSSGQTHEAAAGQRVEFDVDTSHVGWRRTITNQAGADLILYRFHRTYPASSRRPRITA